jgi:phenylpropionate dioxygenase-like ring-hydroxylating dioxygenase large terminal subunit
MSAHVDVAGAVAALDRGLTLPAEWYTSREHHERELEAVFARSWHYVGTTHDLAAPGDYVTTRIGTVPVVVTRDGSGALHGLVNVCRHRCHEVAQGSGNRKTLQCPYHGWTYDLDGRLRNAPRADAEASFDPTDIALLPVRVEAWEPFVFAALDDGVPPLHEALGPVPELMTRYGFHFGGLERRRRIEYAIDANWKVYVENSLECYHCPVAHPGLARAVDTRPEVYQLGADGWVMTHESRLRDAARGEGDNGPLLELRADVPEFQFYYLWPTFMIAPSPKRLWLGTLQPIDVGRTLVVTDFYFEPGLPDDTVDRSVEFSDQVLREDRELVESVQRGLASGRVEHGRLLPASERLLRHFQALVAGALTNV